MTFADEDNVLILVKEVKEAVNDENDFNNLLDKAISYAERKINSKLRKNNINPPVAENEDLTEAGNLYAAYLIFNTYYSGNDRTSPTAAGYKTDADEFVEAYIRSALHNTDGQPYTRRNTSMDWYDTRRRP